MNFIGWLDSEMRWHLPVHQPVEGADFMFPDQCGPCGVCEECAPHRPLAVCGVCSYDPRTGLPTEPVPWPCSAVRTCQDNPAPRPRVTPEDDGNYRPRPTRGGSYSAEARERTKGRKF